MNIFFGLLYLALRLFSYALLARIVLDAIMSFSRSWTPRGAALVFASGVYSLTDKPLGWIRRVIPPVRFGGISLDVGFILLYVVVLLLTGLTSTLF